MVTFRSGQRWCDWSSLGVLLYGAVQAVSSYLHHGSSHVTWRFKRLKDVFWSNWWVDFGNVPPFAFALHSHRTSRAKARHAGPRCSQVFKCQVHSLCLNASQSMRTSISQFTFCLVFKLRWVVSWTEFCKDRFVQSPTLCMLYICFIQIIRTRTRGGFKRERQWTLWCDEVARLPRLCQDRHGAVRETAPLGDIRCMPLYGTGDQVRRCILRDVEDYFLWCSLVLWGLLVRAGKGKREILWDITNYHPW